MVKTPSLSQPVHTKEKYGQAGDEVDSDEQGSLLKAVGNAMSFEVFGSWERHRGTMKTRLEKEKLYNSAQGCVMKG